MTSSTPTPHPRGPVEACAHCGAGEPPYAYLQDGQHYCVRCARTKLITAKIRPAGNRTTDLTYEDVLFTELPLADDATED
jgi:hypothetical protein